MVAPAGVGQPVAGAGQRGASGRIEGRQRTGGIHREDAGGRGAGQAREEGPAAGDGDLRHGPDAVAARRAFEDGLRSTAERAGDHLLVERDVGLADAAVLFVDVRPLLLELLLAKERHGIAVAVERHVPIGAGARAGHRAQQPRGPPGRRAGIEADLRAIDRPGPEQLASRLADRPEQSARQRRGLQALSERRRDRRGGGDDDARQRQASAAGVERTCRPRAGGARGVEHQARNSPAAPREGKWGDPETCTLGFGRMAPLLERERELSTLRTLTEHAAAGGSGLLVIEGPAGIGKTRLVAETRREAAQSGVNVLTARGGELEQELAFGIVRQLFEDAVSGGGEPVPDGAREVFERPATGVAGEDASFTILHGLYWLTLNLAETAPVLLAVDDLQWADEPSLRYLAYLVRRLDGLPVTVLCGVRPIERHSRAHLLAEIIGDPLAVSVHPLPLSERAAAELLGADEAFARAGREATGGNPLLLVELHRTLRTEGVTPDVANLAQVEELAPRAASRAVLVRLARQSRDAVAMARATAVLGDEAKLPLAAALAGLPDQLAVAAAGQLVARRDLRRPGGAGVRAPGHPCGGLRGHRSPRPRARARARGPRAARPLRQRRRGRRAARARPGARRGVGGRGARAGGARGDPRGGARRARSRTSHARSPSRRPRRAGRACCWRSRRRRSWWTCRARWRTRPRRSNCWKTRSSAARPRCRWRGAC